jgi:hypothetical protein
VVPDPEAELALLQRALAALKTRPTTALALTEQHQADYPDGVFVQERDAIAVDALIALQRTTAAEKRARAFLAAFPRSAHAPRIRQLLGANFSPAAQQDSALVPTHQ